MKTPARLPLLFAAAAGALAVVLGAFGAHALRGAIDEHALEIWHTAVEYQFWHALALLGVGALAMRGGSRALRIATVLFALGTVLFSGSLYLLAIGAPRAIGVVTPLGGVALIAGWISLFVHALRVRGED